MEHRERLAVIANELIKLLQRTGYIPAFSQESLTRASILIQETLANHLCPEDIHPREPIVEVAQEAPRVQQQRLLITTIGLATLLLSRAMVSSIRKEGDVAVSIGPEEDPYSLLLGKALEKAVLEPEYFNPTENRIAGMLSHMPYFQPITTAASNFRRVMSLARNHISDTKTDIREPLQAVHDQLAVQLEAARASEATTDEAEPKEAVAASEPVEAEEEEPASRKPPYSSASTALYHALGYLHIDLHEQAKEMMIGPTKYALLTNANSIVLRQQRIFAGDTSLATAEHIEKALTDTAVSGQMLRHCPLQAVSILQVASHFTDYYKYRAAQGVPTEALLEWLEKAKQRSTTRKSDSDK